MKNVVFLSGLPRSGSTVLSNVIGAHPDIRSTPSSPLCTIVQGMRNSWSQDPFLKAQLDSDFEVVTERLKRTTKATIESWSDEGEEETILDKNRGWLFCLEWLREIDPNFKMIVTLRDLRNIYTSIEKKHRKTLLLNFPDNLEHNVVDVRAKNLFDDNGIIGSCLKGIMNVGDIPDISQHLLFWRYEDFIENPEQTTKMCFDFLGVEPIKIDFNNIQQLTHESDSHYNMKFSHKINKSLEPAKGFQEAKISPRIITEIENRFEWYFKAYYPELFATQKQDIFANQEGQDTSVAQSSDPKDQKMINDLEEAIKKETE